MKYTLFGVAVVFFSIALIHYLWARYKVSKVLENAKSPINIIPSTKDSFPITFLNVGIKKFRIPAEVGFEIYNIGKNNLFIKSVVPDCHCTVANFSSNPIYPNDSSKIILKFDASHIGPFQSSALVTTNSSSTPTLLIFRGMVNE
ncbi:MAG TPA: DUF1573 domain-containing protein [Chitinophagaceae bacterium]|nr:DUF1573 domain-containing protein [Chitinophagaceae bacterium]